MKIKGMKGALNRVSPCTAKTKANEPPMTIQHKRNIVSYLFSDRKTWREKPKPIKRNA